jgi:hypothetical protein
MDEIDGKTPGAAPCICSGTGVGNGYVIAVGENFVFNRTYENN